MEYSKELVHVLRENTELLKVIIKEIRNLSLLFEKYDSEYQTEVENQGSLQEG